MTTPMPEPTPAERPAVPWLELFGLLLLLICCIGVAALAATVDWRLAALWCCMGVGFGGVALTLREG